MFGKCHRHKQFSPFPSTGFADGSVVLTKGDITRDRHSKTQILHEGNYPVTGLAFRQSGKITHLFVVTTENIQVRYWLDKAVMEVRLWPTDCNGSWLFIANLPFDVISKKSYFLHSPICCRWKIILVWSWTRMVAVYAAPRLATPPRTSSSLWQETNVCICTSQMSVAPALPLRDRSWSFTGIGDTSSSFPRTGRALQSKTPGSRWVHFTCIHCAVFVLCSSPGALLCKAIVTQIPIALSWQRARWSVTATLNRPAAFIVFIQKEYQLRVLNGYDYPRKCRYGCCVRSYVYIHWKCVLIVCIKVLIASSGEELISCQNKEIYPSVSWHVLSHSPSPVWAKCRGRILRFNRKRRTARGSEPFPGMHFSDLLDYIWGQGNHPEFLCLGGNRVVRLHSWK